MKLLVYFITYYLKAEYIQVGTCFSKVCILITGLFLKTISTV